jgi:hypothetical protein
LLPLGKQLTDDARCRSIAISSTSNDPPNAGFNAVLVGAFAISAAHVVNFDNSHGDHDSRDTVHVGFTADLPIQKAIDGARAPSAD